MYARIITAQVQHNQLDQARRLYREALLPAAQQQFGFDGGWLLLDRNTGKSLMILLWASEAALKGGEASPGFKQPLAKLAACFIGTPLREAYEVS
jgi:quinol monooxygenase YgiN